MSEVLVMRFIGSKANLLHQIDAVIGENTTGEEQVFCDLFSGTGAVARYFKPRYEVYSNDTLYFSYVIQKATIENNKKPTFEKLKAAGVLDPFRFLEDSSTQLFDPAHAGGFIAKHYAPNEHCERMYVTNKNAARIDFIRMTLEVWRKQNLLDESEYFYLLAGLIEGVPSVSNITGTYGAYLKQWDPRAYKDLEMARLDVIDNHRSNRCFHCDANRLIGELEGDILYLDPPYNARQYAPNYHFLETVARYDAPEIRGVTGMRPYEEQKSAFCIKNEVAEAFEDLIRKAKFSNIVMSYSTDGLMREEQIETILKRHGVEESYRMYSIPYRQYKSKKTQRTECLYEHLFYIQKDLPKKQYVICYEGKSARQTPPQPAALADNRRYMKSPMNYIGGKYKLLPQILPHFPQRIGTFVDLFAGGCNVALNVTADRIICNDINSKLIEMFRTFRERSLESILGRIHAQIEAFSLSKENEEGFRAFRDYYNQTGDPVDLYTLTCYSFNYQFRFNNSMEYNNPFGRDRSHFSETMQKNLIAFVNKLKRANIEFRDLDFTEIDLQALTPADFIYCDPPYLITTGSYNDGNRGFRDWREEQELALYRYLDAADARGIKFALSNVLEHKGRKNDLLWSWAKKYQIIELHSSYANSSYNTKKGESKEVLIINY